MTIIAFTGPSGSGKDYQANLLKRYGFKHLKFAMGLRGLVYTQLGIPKVLSKGEEHAQGIQEKLIKVSRTVIAHDRTLWVDILEEVMTRNYTPDSDWVISDMRQPHEYSWVSQSGGILFRVSRENNQIPQQPLDDLLADKQIPPWDPSVETPYKDDTLGLLDLEWFTGSLITRLSHHTDRPYQVLQFAHDYYLQLNPEES